MAVLASVTVFCLGTPGTAAADPGDTGLTWNPRWTRFTTAQYALTAGMAGAVLATDGLLQAAPEPRWRSDVLLDGRTRGLLAADSVGGRRTAAAVSDCLALGLVIYPLAIDTLVAGAVHGNFDIAFQMAMIGVQALLLTQLVTGLTKDLVGRARPDSGRCGPGDDLACGSENQSFLSGHASGAFAGAGLVCAHHQNLALYGDGAAGAIACGLSLGAATAVGTLRIVADRHYLSDVLAGGALGLAAGYLLPNLVNYDFGGGARHSGTVLPTVARRGLGVAYVTRF